MADRRRSGIKERKDICTKGWEVESWDNLVISWYASGRTWRKVEGNRVGDEKLLVVWSDKRHRKIYGWM